MTEHAPKPSLGPSSASARKTVAPDIVGCCLLLYASTLLFAVLRAPYVNQTMGAAALDVAIYGGLLLLCAGTAVGLFRRMALAWPLGLLISVAALLAGALAFHVPDTAQLPAGVLGATGIVLLLARRGEF
jgi:hypothetical protein